MKLPALDITSTANPRIKQVIKLRQRSHRDASGLMLIEGYREILRAHTNHHTIETLFFCADLFQGDNNQKLLDTLHASGTRLLHCNKPVFEKISYRDRPDGLLALGPQLHSKLSDIPLTERPFLVIAESIEKPGNLGTILRSADAAGADAVIVCDRCTDINNPNVVRASIGTLFCRPVVEASSAETIAWLRAHGICSLAATPHAEGLYTQIDCTVPIAIVVGTEQYGLSSTWMEQANHQVRIPMHGQADSLNVATATTILLFEVCRQREMLAMKHET
ncbi:MAG: TrmH family RNA methyltransferase [Kiritimatiellia bacterium]